MKQSYQMLAGFTALLFAVASCNDKEHSGGEETPVDTMSTMPMETPTPAMPDTITPVAPGMDTTAAQAPKM
ncbi:MAG: hypothetical protein EOP49_26940 [Sphingobacteriales bacterium]|nr:MAG: hypothetical protein EOP49_26940 [Sphingobacteriales bacterium]